MIERWINGGHAISLVIGIIIAEMLILGWWLRGRSLPIILAFIPGLCLMLALRAALLGHNALWVALWITASLPFHIADLLNRAKGTGRP